MRVNLNNSFLCLLIFVLLSLYLIVRHHNDSLRLPSNARPLHRPSASSHYLTKLDLIRSRLDQFEYLTSRHNEELQHLQRMFSVLVNTAHHRLSANVSRPYSIDSLHDQVHSHTGQLDLPSITNILPQFSFFDGSLDPLVHHSNPQRWRSSADIVFGIPTVERDVKSYLLSTLASLIANLDQAAKHKALFVVFIAEIDPETINRIATSIKRKFAAELDFGLIEIISPPAIYYQSLSVQRTIKDPMDDSPERVRWRSKQNLDYAYLMMYCKRKGVYYVHLEDDIITKPNYYRTIYEFAQQVSIKKPDWLVIKFSVLGFIGQMFRSSDLPLFATFFLLFYHDKPVDWLLPNVIQVRYCPNDVSMKKCQFLVQKHVITHHPALFQHVGYHSSLKGKLQPLHEKSYSASASGQKWREKLAAQTFISHPDNPPCLIKSTFKSMYLTSIEDVYAGSSAVWIEAPKQGQQLILSFEHQPVQVSRFRIQTGSGSKNLVGRLFGASVWVRPLLRTHAGLQQIYGLPDHGYYRIGKFHSAANGTVDCSLLHMGALHSIRIQVDLNQKYAVVFSEIWVLPKLD